MVVNLFKIVSVFVICTFHVTAASSCQVVSTPQNTASEILDYFWRDYFGVIPPDAIVGGRDKAGNPTYIGQAYIRNFELLPVTIYSGCRSGRASAYNKEIQTDKNIKILCAKNVEKYAWTATKNDETHLLTDCHLVVGGSEIGLTLNIGRVNHDGEVVIGKVFSNPQTNRGLWIPYNGHETHFLTYEILTYNCSCAQQLGVQLQ